MDQPGKSTRPTATIFADNVLDRYDLSFLGITPATANPNGSPRANASMSDSREGTLAGSNGADERGIGGDGRTSVQGPAVSQPSTKTTHSPAHDGLRLAGTQHAVAGSRLVRAGRNNLPGEGQTPFLTEPRDRGVTTDGHSELREGVAGTKTQARSASEGVEARSDVNTEPTSKRKTTSPNTTHHSPFTPTKPRWVAPVWMLVTLLIAGILLGFAFLGNSSSDDELNTIAIGEMDLGRRVKGENPLLDEVKHLPEPDPATSREVRFEMTKPSGNRSWFKLIWSLDEIEAAGAKVGATVDFDMPELGIIGPARCSYIGPCPEFKEGDGNLVIGVFKHEPDGPIVNVHIEGLEKPIGSTANHPFWSEDRQDYVEAGDLQPGEQVWSELRGTVRVKSVTSAPDAKYVYNLTVRNQHVYEVSEFGVLVHNTYAPNRAAGELAEQIAGPGQRLAGQIDTIANMRPFADRLADITANPSRWKVVRSASEASTNIRNRGGRSLQEILRNEETGETIVRHTIFKPDGSIFEAPHFRPFWK